MNNECVLWLYGLPGTGKSEIAHALVEQLRLQRYVVCLLEEHMLRAGLGADLGVTLEDQIELERRTAQMAATLAEQGVCVVVTFVTAREAQRVRIRRILASVPYHLVQFERAEEARVNSAGTASIPAQATAQCYERSVADLTLDTGLLQGACVSILLNMLNASRHNHHNTAAVPHKAAAAYQANAPTSPAKMANLLNNATQSLPTVPTLQLPKSALETSVGRVTRPSFKQNWIEREKDKLIMMQNALEQENGESQKVGVATTKLEMSKKTVPTSNKIRNKRHVGLDMPWYAHLPIARWSVGGVGVTVVSCLAVGVLALQAYKQMSPKPSNETKLLAAVAAVVTNEDTAAKTTTTRDNSEPTKLEELIKKTDTSGKQKVAEKAHSIQQSGVKTSDLSHDVQPLTRNQLIEQAQKIAQGFKKAKTWQEKVAFVYQGDELRPIMQNYYEKEQRTDPELLEIVSVDEVYQDQKYTLKCQNAEQLNSNEACLWLRKDSRNQLKIDWESLVGYSEVAWSELKTKRPTEAVLMRAQCQMADYYNYEFTDRKKYLCWKLTSPDGKHTIYAYSLQATHLKFLANRYSSNKALPITVRVAFPEKAESNECVILSEIVEEDWLVAAH